MTQWHHRSQHKLGPTWPILTLAYKTAKLELRNMRRFPLWIKHETVASMKTKYGMTKYMTCPHSRFNNDDMYTAYHEDHKT